MLPRLAVASLALVGGLSIDALIATPAAAQTSPVTARAWVDKDQVRPGDLVRLVVAIDNRGTVPVSKVRFTNFQSPAFTRTACWVAATPSCHAEGQRYTDLPPIAAGDSLVVYALLTRRNDELPDGGKVLLTGTFQWSPELPPVNPPTAPTVFTGAVSTSAIEIAPTRWYSSPLALSIREFSKDLVLPLVVLLGGYLFQRFQHARTERQVIWTEMLGKVTRDTEQHFLPFASAVANFLDDVEHFLDEVDAVQGSAARRDQLWVTRQHRLVHDLLILNTQMTRLIDAVGGFYLALRPAETVIQTCWHAFREQQRRCLGAEEALTRTVARMEVKALPLGTFTDRLKPPRGALAQFRDRNVEFRGDVEAISVAAKAWIVGQAGHFREHEMKYLYLLLAVLDAEVDRPFERWYGMRPHVNRPALLAWQRGWEVSTAEPLERRIAAAIAVYHRETGVFWQLGLGKPWRTVLMLKQWSEDRRAKK